MDPDKDDEEDAAVVVTDDNKTQKKPSEEDDEEGDEEMEVSSSTCLQLILSSCYCVKSCKVLYPKHTICLLSTHEDKCDLMSPNPEKWFLPPNEQFLKIGFLQIIKV